MAKIFYTLDEALAKIGCEESALKGAVRDGTLREFRDAGKINYKVDEIDKLAKSGELGGPTGAGDADQADLSASLGPISLSDTDNPMPDLSTSGSIGLTDTGGINLAGSEAGGTAVSKSGATGTPADLSGSSAIDLAATGDEDIVSLDDEEAAAEQTVTGKSKDDTVVSSVGVSVFDEEDLEESADPLAKTMMTGSAAGGTGLEGVGSGSGLLDLTRESDDTSLGAELLDEIYPGDESGTLEMGEATRAGLAEDVPEPAASASGTALEPAEELEAAGPVTRPTVTVTTVAYAPDAFAHGASALVAVAVVVMCFAGLAVASMIRGNWPSILDFVYGKLWMFGLGAVVAAGAAAGLGVFLGKRSTDKGGT